MSSAKYGFLLILLCFVLANFGCRDAENGVELANHGVTGQLVIESVLENTIWKKPEDMTVRITFRNESNRTVEIPSVVRLSIRNTGNEKYAPPTFGDDGELNLSKNYGLYAYETASGKRLHVFPGNDRLSDCEGPKISRPEEQLLFDLEGKSLKRLTLQPGNQIRVVLRANDICWIGIVTSAGDKLRSNLLDLRRQGDFFFFVSADEVESNRTKIRIEYKSE